MSAIYPGAVRSFIEHQDGTEIIDASYVNALQDETVALEQTVGILPQVYAPSGGSTVTYGSVGGRLDAHEGAIAAQQTQINSLLAATRIGWGTPVLNLQCTNLVPPRMDQTNATANIIWNVVVQDSADMWGGASILTCPLGGQWQITVTFKTSLDYATLNTTQQNYNSLQINPTPLAFQAVMLFLFSGTTELTQATNQCTWHPEVLALNPYLGVTGTWTGPLSTGQQVYATAGVFFGNVSGLATISATYLRALEGVS